MCSVELRITKLCTVRSKSPQARFRRVSHYRLLSKRLTQELRNMRRCQAVAYCGGLAATVNADDERG